MKKIIFILSLLFLAVLNTFSQIGNRSEFDEEKVIKEKVYYPNGQLRYVNITKRKGLGKNNTIYGKQIIKLVEYYENGQKKLKEKKIIPRIIEDEHLTDERHILRQKREYRKYKKWNIEGDKIEKGRYGYRGGKRIVKYNYLNHKKVIIKYDIEHQKDIYIKKKPLYRSDK